MYETYLRLYLSPILKLVVDDHYRLASLPLDDPIPTMVGDVAVSTGDSASACIVHWYEETARKVDS